MAKGWPFKDITSIESQNGEANCRRNKKCQWHLASGVCVKC